MAATTIKTRQSASSAMLLCYTVIIALISSLALSVEAIKCHQCNSHLDEDCTALRLSLPRAPVDNQYLRECEGEGKENAFCRKTVLTIEATGEHRLVRSCGYNDSDLRNRENSCFNADNEGLLQTLCACFKEGCNAAPSHLGSSNKMAIFGLAGVCVFAASLLRRIG